MLCSSIFVYVCLLYVGVYICLHFTIIWKFIKYNKPFTADTSGRPSRKLFYFVQFLPHKNIQILKMKWKEKAKPPRKVLYKEGKSLFRPGSDPRLEPIESGCPIAYLIPTLQRTKQKLLEPHQFWESLSTLTLWFTWDFNLSSSMKTLTGGSIYYVWIVFIVIMD